MAKGVSRDRRRETRWRRIIRDHGRSGLGVREFCRRGNLTETAFYFWRRELLRRDGERQETDQEQRRPQGRADRASQAAAAPAFVTVRVEEQSAASPAGGRIEIMLSGGRRIHVTAPVDRQALADVLAVLEGAAGDGHNTRADRHGDSGVGEDGEGLPSFAKATEGEPC